MKRLQSVTCYDLIVHVYIYSVVYITRDIEEFWHDEIHVNLCSLEQGQEEKQPTEKQSGLKK